MKTVKWTLCLAMFCAATFALQMSAFAADTDALVVTETGNVGIGIDDPQYRLEVDGNVHSGHLVLGPWPTNSAYTVFGNSTLDQAQGRNYALLQHDTTGRTFLNSPSDIRFRIKNADKMVLSGGGYVGIGTATPSTELHIKGSTPQITMQPTADAQSAGRLVFQNTAGTNIGQMIYDTTHKSLHFYVGGPSFERMRIDSSGNVGIGTTSPGAKLHINGSVRGHQAGALKIDTGNGYVSIGPRNASWAHFYTDREKYYFNKEIRVNSGNIGSYNGNLNLRTIGTNRITVLSSNGNVGIGTTSPSQKLHVHGGVYVKDSINCYNLTTHGGIPADFVFAEDYDLPDLGEVKSFIQKNKHLPEIPSALEIQANGVSVSDMLMKHLQKIEELTLYMIDLKSDNTKLQSENGDLRAMVHHLEERLSKLETQALDIDEMNN